MSKQVAPHGPRKGEEEQTQGHTVKGHVEEDWTGSRLTYAQKKVQVLMQFTKSGQELKKKYSLKKKYV